MLGSGMDGDRRQYTKPSRNSGSSRTWFYILNVFQMFFLFKQLFKVFSSNTTSMNMHLLILFEIRITKSDSYIYQPTFVKYSLDVYSYIKILIHSLKKNYKLKQVMFLIF